MLPLPDPEPGCYPRRSCTHPARPPTKPFADRPLNSPPLTLLAYVVAHFDRLVLPRLQRRPLNALYVRNGRVDRGDFGGGGRERRPSGAIRHGYGLAGHPKEPRRASRYTACFRSGPFKRVSFGVADDVAPPLRFRDLTFVRLPSLGGNVPDFFRPVDGRPSEQDLLALNIHRSAPAVTPGGGRTWGAG